jgi:hypothetical protein
VKLPRFRIAWAMVFVAVAAINFAAVRAVLVNPGPISEALVIGALPMASVLAVGLLFGRGRPDRRPFLLGFTSFGAAALTAYVIQAVFFADATVMPYLRLFIEPLVQTIGREQLLIYIPVAYSVAVVAATLPQVAIALLGGLLSRWYKVTIVRR